MRQKKLAPRCYWKNGQWRYKVPKQYAEKLADAGYPKTWVSLGKSADEAHLTLAKVMKVMKVIKEESDDACSGVMAEVFSRFEREVIVKKSPRTQIDYRRHLKNLRKSFGHLDPADITESMAQEYLDKRGLSSEHQANHEIGTLRRCFKYAKRWKLYMGNNPVRDVELYTIELRSRLPLSDELECFKLHASPFCRAWVDFKLETGLRQGDILNLQPKKHFADDGIRIVTGKTGEKLFFPWTDYLHQCVHTLQTCNRKQGAYLVCNSEGKQLSRDSFASRWQNSMKKALNAKHKPLRERFTEHDIRATHATKIAEYYGMEVAQTNLGHSDIRMTQAYVRKKRYNKARSLNEAIQNRNNREEKPVLEYEEE